MIRLHMNDDKGKTIVSRVAWISRHRIETDGPGIRTLVPLCGCRLDCAYCINGSLRSFKAGEPFVPEVLYEWVKIDDIYFIIFEHVVYICIYSGYTVLGSKCFSLFLIDIADRDILYLIILNRRQSIRMGAAHGTRAQYRKIQHVPIPPI